MHVRIFFREKLKQMIEACKALHENFDERRREVRAEKQKKIRELTDPNHAWDSPLESEQPAAAVAVEPVMTPVDEQPAAAAVVPTAATAAAPADAVPGYYQYQVRASNVEFILFLAVSFGFLQYLKLSFRREFIIYIFYLVEM